MKHSTPGFSDRDRAAFGTVAGRHRRPGRIRQDRPHRCTLSPPARGPRDRGDHERHLYTGRRRVPDSQRGVACGQDRGGRDGRMPAPAIREDSSINLEAIAAMVARIPEVELVFVESGGDNLSASFSPELVDRTIYVIDVAAGDKIRARGTRHHAVRPVGRQQGRSGPSRGCRLGGNGCRCQAHARFAARGLLKPQDRFGSRGDCRLCRSSAPGNGLISKRTAELFDSAVDGTRPWPRL